MELSQLEQFAAIAQSTTMREAAEKLHLSQPALSQSLKKLERELGCQLFDRSHNQLRITPYGEILLERAHRIMFDLKEVRDEIEQQRQREAATVRMGFFSKPTCVFLAPQIASAFPEMHFEATVESGSATSALLNGDVDMIVVPEGKHPEGLACIRLFEEHAALSVPRDFPQPLGDTVRLSDIADLEILAPSEFGGLSGWYDSLLKAAGVQACNVMRLDELEYLSAMDETERVHLTTTFMSAFMGEDSQRRTVPIDDARASRPIDVCWRDGEERMSAIASFLASGSIRFVGGHAFLPYLLYPGKSGNLDMSYR